MWSRNSSPDCVEEHLLSEKEEDFGLPNAASRRPSSLTRLLPFCIVLNVVLSAALVLGWIFWTPHSCRNSLAQDEVYSPAESATEYKTVVFHSGLHGDITKYQGPSDEVDKKWDDLYADGGLSQISRESAAKLPNATTPLSFDHGLYVVQLDVFHQLHCLNMLRKLMYPSKYPIELSYSSAEAQQNLIHHEHCVESLRQSLQCSSDIGTIYWEWSPQNKMMMGNTATTHTCRDFEKIQEWAKLHKLEQGFDMQIKVEGAPVRKAG